jgi:hypothetical protein
MRFSLGRQRLPRMRPSTLEFMWQIAKIGANRHRISVESGR